jgi:hypothetical protein
MYITDLETNKKSKEINVSDLVFNDYVEFEFGNYEDEDYGTLPYKDFKFFINDYAVTFYSPQCENLKQELDQCKNNWEELKKWLNEEYDHYDKYGSAPTGCAMGEIKRTLNKMKELEEDK